LIARKNELFDFGAFSLTLSLSVSAANIAFSNTNCKQLIYLIIIIIIIQYLSRRFPFSDQNNAIFRFSSFCFSCKRFLFSTCHNILTLFLAADLHTFHHIQFHVIMRPSAHEYLCAHLNIHVDQFDSMPDAHFALNCLKFFLANLIP
jgi:hypothetical protein